MIVVFLLGGVRRWKDQAKKRKDGEKSQPGEIFEDKESLAVYIGWYFLFLYNKHYSNAKLFKVPPFYCSGVSHIQVMLKCSLICQFGGIRRGSHIAREITSVRMYVHEVGYWEKDIVVKCNWSNNAMEAQTLGYYYNGLYLID